MPQTLKLIESVVGEPTRHSFQLKLVSETVTAKEIVAQHVAAEVGRENTRRAKTRADHDRAASFLVGIAQHPDEARLNKTKKRPKLPKLDADAEIDAAQAAFEARQVIMLVDDKQIEDLTATVTVTDDSEVQFLRLVPLVGG